MVPDDAAASLDIAAEVARFRPGIAAQSGRIPQLLQGRERARLLSRARDFEGKGIPGDLALAAASLLDSYSLLDCIEIAEDTGERLDHVADVYFLTSDTFSIDAMLTGSPHCPAITAGTRWLGARCETTCTRFSTC